MYTTFIWSSHSLVQHPVPGDPHGDPRRPQPPAADRRRLGRQPHTHIQAGHTPRRQRTLPSHDRDPLVLPVRHRRQRHRDSVQSRPQGDARFAVQRKHRVGWVILIKSWVGKEMYLNFSCCFFAFISCVFFWLVLCFFI